MLVSLALVFPVGACTLSSGEPAAPPVTQSVANGAETSAEGGLTSGSATLDGLTRTWSVYSPAEVSGDPSAPVLLVLHGTGDTGSGIRNGIGPDLEKLADEYGFSIAYVDGHENNWNECRREGDWPAKELGLDDVGLMREVVGSLGSTGPVFALGFSSGGHMAMRLAVEAPDLVDGIGVVAANPPTSDNQTCEVAGDPVPVMFVQGREDRVNPVEGGEVRVGAGPFARSRGEVLSAVDGARWFAERNELPGAGRAPTGERDGDAEIVTWEGADPVRLVVVDDVGHSFPTLSGRWGRDGGARYDAPGEIWRFLSRSALG